MALDLFWGEQNKSYDEKNTVNNAAPDFSVSQSIHLQDFCGSGFCVVMHCPVFQATGASDKLLKNILIQFHPVPENPRVGGSIPPLGTIKFNKL